MFQKFSAFHARLALLVLLLAFVGAYALREYRRHQVPEIHPIEAQGGKTLDVLLQQVPFYIQNDPRWGAQKLGATPDTLSSVGCTISAVSMALGYYQISILPGELNTALSQVGGYTSRGWLIWNKLKPVSQNKVEAVIPAQPSYTLMDQALEQGRPVIANVLMNKTISHWVLVVGKKGQDYLIHDPLGKTHPESLSKFKSKIYAIRILRPVA